jgi:hypothetical protein
MKATLSFLRISLSFPRKQESLAILLGLIAIVLIIGGCGDPPSAPPDQLKGDLVVMAFLPDSSLAAYMRLVLDGDTLVGDTAVVDLLTGDTLMVFHNPATLHGILAGNHQVITSAQVSESGTVVHYAGSQIVAVSGNTVAETEVRMLGLAPNFSLMDVSGNTIIMDDLTGRIRLLYFFSFT